MRPIKSVSFIKNRQNHLLKDACTKFTYDGGGGEKKPYENNKVSE